MLLYGAGDGRVSAFRLIHHPPHLPLQTSEFDHRLGDQIAFGELGGRFRHVRVGAHVRRDFAGERGDAVGLVADAAELLVEHDRVELVVIACERLFAVLLLEKERIGQPRRDDLGVPRLDRRARVRSLQIGDDDEVRGEFSFGSAHRERLLVALEG